MKVNRQLVVVVAVAVLAAILLGGAVALATSRKDVTGGGGTTTVDGRPGGSSTSAVAGPPPSPLPTGPQLTTSPGDVKPVLRGLLDRKGMPSKRFRPVLSGFVVDVAWADIEPQPGTIATNNALDQAIAAVQTAQPSDGEGMQIKLRVRAGTLAPEWAKHLGGDPVEVVDQGQTATVGRFWTPEFGRAYSQLQSGLAARYDGAAELRQVTVSRCSTFFAEPFLRQWGDEATQRNLLAAGYNVDLDAQCQREEIDAHLAWTRTRSGLAFNPYQRISPDATVVADELFTETMMGYCRATLQARCVLENYSIRSLAQDDPYPQMYAALARLGAPLGFQTAAEKRIGDWYQTCSWAVKQGANSIELNRDYPHYDINQLRQVNGDLAASKSP